jgi:uncharacterized protein (DUF433 family)
MSLVVGAEPIPLVTDSDGIVRIGSTRVTLDTIVAAFHDGATAEEILQQYPSLQLADVYAVIGYYLRHQREVEAYLRERQQHSEAVRQENEARFDPRGVRDRLLARRKHPS